MIKLFFPRNWRLANPADKLNSHALKRWATVFVCTFFIGKLFVTTSWPHPPISELSSDPENYSYSNEHFSQDSLSYIPQNERSLKSIKPTHESQLASLPVHEEHSSNFSNVETVKRKPLAPPNQYAQLPGKLNENFQNKNIFVPPSRPAEEWVASQEQEYERRKSKVRAVCETSQVQFGRILTEEEAKQLPSYPYIDQDPPVERPNREHFTLAAPFNTMGCLINKVASSSLVSAFLIVSGYSTSFSSPHSLAFRLRPQNEEQFRYANASYFKFMFVRHPMERLLSCYRDKMLTSPHWSLPTFRIHIKTRARQVMEQRRLLQSPHAGKPQRKLLQYAPASQTDHQIMNELLKPDMDTEMAAAVEALNRLATAQQNKDLGKPPSLQTSQTMNILRQQLRQQTQAQRAASSTMTNSEKDGNEGIDYTEKPTFEEFLEYILSTDLQGNGYDAHWVPYWRYCTPCNVPYDMIGKIETATDDLTYLWHRTGLYKKVPIPWFNRQKSVDKKLVQREFYSTLPRDLILRVYQRFRLDFEMFDYSINEVLVDAGYEPLPNVY